MNNKYKVLEEEKLSCIVYKENQIYKTKASGIKPIIEFLENGILENACVIDKIIGKAAAMLMVYGHVKEVYTPLISTPALSFLKQNKISITYEKEVPYIINRKKDGMCIMEKAVLECDSAKEAYHLLKNKLSQLP